MKIIGETMIFRNDIGYSTSISRKKEDGTYENMFIPVSFRKGVEVQNKTKINIIDGFMSFYKNKNGLAIPKFVIMDFETNKEETQEFMSESDLPF